MLKFRVRDLPDNLEHVFNIYLEHWLNSVCSLPYTVLHATDYASASEIYKVQLDPSDHFVIKLKDFPQELKSYITID